MNTIIIDKAITYMVKERTERVEQQDVILAHSHAARNVIIGQEVIAQHQPPWTLGHPPEYD
jgi:hypothetical protein